MVSALGHCGVQFRLKESGVLGTCWGLSFGILWHLVQADRRWVIIGPI